MNKILKFLSMWMGGGIFIVLHFIKIFFLIVIVFYSLSFGYFLSELSTFVHSPMNMKNYMKNFYP